MDPAVVTQGFGRDQALLEIKSLTKGTVTKEPKFVSAGF
jgi:hypothetical protein